MRAVQDHSEITASRQAGKERVQLVPEDLEMI